MYCDLREIVCEGYTLTVTSQHQLSQAGGIIDTRQLHKLGRQDIAQAGRILAENFTEDPLYVHILPDEETRLSVLTIFFTNYLYMMYDSSDLLVTSERMEGIAVVFHPERMQTSLSRLKYSADIVQAIVRSVGISRYIGFKAFVRGVRTLNSMSSAWLANLEDKNYMHLDMLIVQQAYRGQGVVSHVMGELLSECRKQQKACTLETQSERNVSIYGHYGFQTVEVIPLQGSALKQYCMLCRP
ncbi:GNAT family N-acetyltransferase [Paenibacillus pini]|uniref:Acetyltransferase n=1 Tax=Paenibacillus pini JCM 16418 TaxID=1236976 RepID=W7Z721_9BACL|nr:GNAT family N-acetyltransferase [Paenibacillus pini]GAF10069.1 acetyltransferase [Paenibacillus pini JCM 16418]